VVVALEGGKEKFVASEMFLIVAGVRDAHSGGRSLLVIRVAFHLREKWQVTAGSSGQ
jgi:hypothetical protein